jgi:hypothetical protein
VSDGIYASDPNAAPDSEFWPGELRYLVAGNRGRLLDARRTPITITSTDPARGSFEVEIGAFEDAGARWELPLDDVGRFQFAHGASVVADGFVSELEQARRRFDRELVVDCDPAVRSRTLRQIDGRRGMVRERLGSVARVDLAARVEAREGDARLFAFADEVMDAVGVMDLEQRFTTTFVTNPRSGEFVKGHAIVLAELGLCPYRGKVVRDPDLFEEPWCKARRAEHLIARLAFTSELWSSVAGQGSVILYRGAAVAGPLPEPSPSSFVSATFSREVGASHFEGGPTTETAVLWRQRVPVRRLLMTFLETREMNRRFKEAEAVLIADPANRAF